MFYFRLMGGLGNQMFQYAAAKALSVARGIPFKLDFDCPYRHIKYRYALGVFMLDAHFATIPELVKCKPKKRLVRRLYRLLGINPECALVCEKREFHFDESFFGIPDGAYVSGFWQSERYFTIIENELRSDFSFRSRPEGAGAVLCDQMRREQSVSVHLRRGDYVRVEATNKVHGVCSPQYYSDAIAYVLARVPNAVFYVFSDDIEWVRGNFRIPAPMHIVDLPNRGQDHEDMRLMSHCRHHVIANSSFSWWGAWLNADQGKMVIAPKQWMRDPNIVVRDLLPESWVRL